MNDRYLNSLKKKIYLRYDNSGIEDIINSKNMDSLRILRTV